MNRIIEPILVIALSALIASSIVLNIDPRYSVVLTSISTSTPTLVYPGIHFKLPLPLQNTTFVDMRIQSLDIPDQFQILTSDKHQLLAAYTIMYRVSDVIRYAEKINRQSPRLVVNELSKSTRFLFRNAFSKRSLNNVISEQRTITNEVRYALQDIAKDLGLDIVDIRLTRVDIPATKIADVYRRMGDEMKKQAAQIRTDSDLEIHKIINCANYNSQVLLENAYERAQRIKGEGDAKAASIAIDMFSRDLRFYKLYASLQAYRDIFKYNDIIIISPDSEFFRFMRSPFSR